MARNNAILIAILFSLSCAPESGTERAETEGACAACGPPAGVAVPPPQDVEASCEGPVRYPQDRTQSPLTCAVAERLRDLSAGAPELRDDSFMKVGDSISATHEFLHCFETEELDLDATGHGHLADTLAHFSRARFEGTTPFARTSAATRVGMTASWALEGDPSPIAQERRTMTPRYALVLFGTNDVQFGGPTAPADVKYAFMADSMRSLVDWHLERGVAPVLYSLPPYAGEHPEIRQLVPTYNALLRGLAEHRLLPFVDLHREMKGLPNQGLRDDGVHPSADYVRLCNFDERGLQLGYNLRNLLTLEALDRVWSVTRPEGAAEALDEGGAPPLQGEGSSEDPWLIDAMPFGDMTHPSLHGEAHDLEAACLPGGEEAVRLRYLVTLAEPTPLRLVALGFSGARVRLTSGHEEEPRCPEAAALTEATFPEGTHEIILDVVRPEGGEAALVVDRCQDDDTRCR